jgi:hypothetical protein
VRFRPIWPLAQRHRSAPWRRRFCPELCPQTALRNSNGSHKKSLFPGHLWGYLCIECGYGTEGREFESLLARQKEPVEPGGSCALMRVCRVFAASGELRRVGNSVGNKATHRVLLQRTAHPGISPRRAVCRGVLPRRAPAQGVHNHVRRGTSDQAHARRRSLGAAARSAGSIRSGRGSFECCCSRQTPACSGPASTSTYHPSLVGPGLTFGAL